MFNKDKLILTIKQNYCFKKFEFIVNFIYSNFSLKSISKLQVTSVFFFKNKIINFYSFLTKFSYASIFTWIKLKSETNSYFKILYYFCSNVTIVKITPAFIIICYALFIIVIVHPSNIIWEDFTLIQVWILTSELLHIQTDMIVAYQFLFFYINGIFLNTLLSIYNTYINKKTNLKEEWMRFYITFAIFFIVFTNLILVKFEFFLTETKNLNRVLWSEDYLTPFYFFYDFNVKYLFITHFTYILIRGLNFASYLNFFLPRKSKYKFSNSKLISFCVASLSSFYYYWLNYMYGMDFEIRNIFLFPYNAVVGCPYTDSLIHEFWNELTLNVFTACDTWGMFFDDFLTLANEGSSIYLTIFFYWFLILFTKLSITCTSVYYIIFFFLSDLLSFKFWIIYFYINVTNLILIFILINIFFLMSFSNNYAFKKLFFLVVFLLIILTHSKLNFFIFLILIVTELVSIFILLSIIVNITYFYKNEKVKYISFLFLFLIFFPLNTYLMTYSYYNLYGSSNTQLYLYVNLILNSLNFWLIFFFVLVSTIFLLLIISHNFFFYKNINIFNFFNKVTHLNNYSTNINQTERNSFFHKWKK